MSITINETISFIKSKTCIQPVVGIVLGSGLSKLSEKLQLECSLLYSDIPGFPNSTVEGHNGRLLFGTFAGKQVVMMDGRFHFYEGYSMSQLIFPIRVLAAMGIRYLLLSNAAGGVNPHFSVGDIMVITDHINLMPNPLIGPHNNQWGARFPDMSQAYNRQLIQQAEQLAKAENIPLQKGVYVAMTGPTYETPAEYRFVRIIGGDAVGMSTVPEVIAAHQYGVQCFAVSVITDLGVEGKIEVITHDHVLKAAQQAGLKVALLFEKLTNVL